MLKGSIYLSRQQDCAHFQTPTLLSRSEECCDFLAGAKGGGERGFSFAALDLERKIAAICSSRRGWSMI